MIQIFQISRNEKKSERYAHGFVRHAKSGQIGQVFRAQIDLPKSPEIHLYYFLTSLNS